MFSFFKKKESTPLVHLTTDIHSHLIPGVDDGVKSFEESISLIRNFEEAGYNKLITTPHIMHDFYNNSESHLRKIHNDLVQKLRSEQIDMQLQLAAEYYLDDHLLERMDNKQEEFLTFGENYLLFETSFMNQPFQLAEFIFKAKSRGLKPVLAHPERYLYLLNDDRLLSDLVDREIYFQLNINSISGYYSKQVKKFAQRLIDEKLVHFLGSDCHNELHFKNILQSRDLKYYHKALELPLLNNTL